MSISGKEATTGFDLKVAAKILKIFHHLYLIYHQCYQYPEDISPLLSAKLRD